MGDVADNRDKPTQGQKARRIGRPRKYETAEDLEDAVDAYWNSLKKPMRVVVRGKYVTVTDPTTGELVVDDEAVPPTEADLILWLGISPTTWDAYGSDEGAYPGYPDVVARAMLRLEGYANRALFSKDGARGAEVQLSRRHAGRGWAAPEQRLAISGVVAAIPLPADPAALMDMIQRATAAISGATLPVIEGGAVPVK